jgi:mRNA-degrading endonuclease RelE of RelBE toxin-antitoxin system
MHSKLTARFRASFKKLPNETRTLAVQSYKEWASNPKHPSLHFKPVHPKRLNIWSVRVGADYRALALVENDTAKWFWIGTHKEYDSILANLKAVAKGTKQKTK